MRFVVLFILACVLIIPCVLRVGASLLWTTSYSSYNGARAKQYYYRSLSRLVWLPRQATLHRIEERSDIYESFTTLRFSLTQELSPEAWALLIWDQNGFAAPGALRAVLEYDAKKGRYELTVANL